MADIKTHLNNIKGALYGKDVRGSIHDGIDAINTEVENTTGRQVDLENTFDQLVINAGNSNAEIVDARVKSDGTSYSKLGDRLDSVDSQLAHIENESEGLISVKKFGAKGDGVEDDTQSFQDAIDYAISKNNKTIYIPNGFYKITKTLKIKGEPNCWDLKFIGCGKGIHGRGSCLYYTGEDNLIEVDLSYNNGGWRGITFKDMSFLGDDKNNSGLKIIFCQQAKFDNISFSNFKSAVKITGDSHYPIFLNCRFSSCNIGINMLDIDDAEYLEGDGNNGKVDNCFFTYCDNPIYQGGYSSEWTLINSDFEGDNGAIVLNNNNRMINCRIERNIHSDNWLRIIGCNNDIDINIHGVGVGLVEVKPRILITGNNNSIKGNFGYLIVAINDMGNNNKFNINTDNGKYESLTTYILKPNSFVFNNHNTEYNINNITDIGERGANLNGHVEHPVYKTVHPRSRSLGATVSRHTFVFSDDDETVKTYFLGCDMYIQEGNTDKFEINVLGQHLGLNNTGWFTIINVTYKTLINGTYSIVKNGGTSGDYSYYAISNVFISALHPPINYISFNNTPKIEKSNFINGCVYTEELKENNLKYIELGNLKINYKGRILKYNNGLVDDANNPILFKSSVLGAIPSTNLIARVEVNKQGQFLDCVLKRDNTNENFTVIHKKAINCDCTGANTVGTLIGCDSLEGNEIIVTLFR